MELNRFFSICRIPLLGRIPCCAVAIAVGFEVGGRIAKLRFYVDGSPSDWEQEAIEGAAEEIYTSAIDAGIDIDDVKIEIAICSSEYDQLEPLDGWLYARLGSEHA